MTNIELEHYKRLAEYYNYPNVCPTCKNEETELCEWCGHNQNYEPIQPQEGDLLNKTDTNFNNHTDKDVILNDSLINDRAVSLKAVLKLVNDRIGNYYIAEAIKRLPSVSQPQIASDCVGRKYIVHEVERTHGHWIGIDEEPHEDYECDRCGYMVSTFTANIKPSDEYKFCPNCGAKMVEPQESEE